MIANCTLCGKTLNRFQSQIKKHKNHFCNNDCRNEYNNLKKSKLEAKPCEFCGKDTANPKFCNSSCAASYLNNKFPKRKKTYHYCQTCGIEVSYRRKYCDNCNPKSMDWSKFTIKEVTYDITSSYGASNRYTRIRDNSKRVYKDSGLPQSCASCGYDKYFEVCHIIPIHAFDVDTPISEVNSLKNLIALCPNCHWELDNGLLDISKF